MDICPLNAIIVDDNRWIDWEVCDRCLECSKVCPAGAIESVGKYMSAEEVIREIEKDMLFYLNSGGGVTFTGGEPLSQAEFVNELSKQCKERHIHTTLDTSGYAPWGVVEKVLENIDLVLYDIKKLDSNAHEEGTGVTNELILENAKKVASKVTTWLRIPVIPGYNDSEGEIKQLAEFAADLEVEKVSLLPYHNWGESKYEKLGRNYLLAGLESPSERHLQRLKEILESYGLLGSIGR